MQLHQEMRARALQLADTGDALAAAAARQLLHGVAAAARLSRGHAPIAPVGGPATSHRVVADLRLARLLHYPARGARRATPVVIVASLINRFYVLDLLPELSVIDGLAARGFDVFVLDWKAPGADGPRLGFADYVDGAIPQAMDAARAATGAATAHLLGYCMGGTLAAIHAARHPDPVRTLVLLGTPIDFHASGVLADWTRRERFDADLLIDVHGNMPPALLQAGFKLLRPLDALLKVRAMFESADDERRLRHMVALESWLEDNLAFPGGVYREYIRELYQDNALVRGRLRIGAGGGAVDLARIAAPLCTVVALRDHICEPPSSRALHDLVSSTERRLLEFDGGHIGLTTSPRAHRELWPAIGAFLEERSA